MQFLKDAVSDAVKRHPFQRIANLTPSEFSELMTDILKEAMSSREFQDRLADELRGALPHLR